MMGNAITFKKVLERITALADNSDGRIRKPIWREIDFVEAEPDVRAVVRMAVDLRGLPLESLPDNTINQGVDAAKEFARYLEELSNFSTVRGRVLIPQMKSFVYRIHDAANKFYSAVGLWIPYLAYHRGDAEENIQKLNVAILTASRMSEAHLKTLENKNKEAAELVERIKSASAEAGVAVYTQDFLEESSRNDKTASTWLWVTIVLSGLTLVVLAVFYSASIDAADILHLLPMLGCRVLAITFLFTATIWCGKMYKAMRNQAIQNRHRALGLKTFRAFVDATLDNQTKDSVLRETTHAIFTATPTGLVNESGQCDVDPSIVQIAGGMLSSQGKA